MAAIPKDSCPHFAGVSETPSFASSSCAECGAFAPTRVCLSCGHVGCCDSSRGHATAHARESDHPIIRSLPLSDGAFTWCYECNAYLR
ncbi:MAG: UBP-type zinc finger domain-containing protein [Pyrinomonadaceae bacterium]